MPLAGAGQLRIKLICYELLGRAVGFQRLGMPNERTLLFQRPARPKDAEILDGFRASRQTTRAGPGR
jgi:hypothetical protein